MSLWLIMRAVEPVFGALLELVVQIVVLFDFVGVPEEELDLEILPLLADLEDQLAFARLLGHR